MSIMLAGLALGLSLIIALGPQNLLVIRQGARREGITAVVLVCLISDVVLFTGGTLGVGLIVERAPLLLEALRWAGVVYLGWFSLAAFWAALRPGAATVVDSSAPAHEQASASGGGVAVRERVEARPRRRAWVRPMWAAIALTWLNPSAYLDSLVMIGSVANQYGADGRWWFTAGALLGSLIWFPLLGYGSRLLSGPLSSPRVWRVLNVVIGLVLAVIAVQVALQ